METIAENIKQITKIIEETAIKCGRDPKDISLMAVSKTKPLSMLMEAYNAGMRLFGENRVQEAVDKRKELPSDAQIELIGHLQSNKARLSTGHFSCIQSIDSIKIASRINNYAGEKGTVQDILIEVNTSQEASKSGFIDDKEFFESLKVIVNMDNIRVNGLMTIAPFTDDEQLIRKSFRKCRTLFEQSKKLYPESDMSVLSMGMSGDFKIAIEEGATLIRVGSLIFGTRN